MSEAAFVEPGDPRWDALLRRCPHDLYHLPGYVETEAEWYGGRALAYCWQQGSDALLIPLIERATPSALGRDGMSPYGYSSPVGTPGIDTAVLAAALQSFQQAAAERGWSASFLRLHPMLGADLAAAIEAAGLHWHQVRRGETVDLPMAEDDDSWLTSLPKGLRYDIRRLERAGCRLLVDTDEAWQAFPAIYLDTMRRIGASSIYWYSAEHVQRLRERLGDALHCAALVDHTGEVMCAGLFSRVGSLLQYHLSGSDARFAALAPTKLMLARVRAWARTQGVSGFHLGGGFGGGGDTLFAFKQRFGGSRYPFNTVSAVHDPARYRAECEWWLSRADRALAGPDGFFPPYRAPLRLAA